MGSAFHTKCPYCGKRLKAQAGAALLGMGPRYTRTTS